MSFVFSPEFPKKPSYQIGEIAEVLGVHVGTVRRWTDEGRLPCIRLGSQRRISYEALKSFVQQNRA
jgi:excisionase family DNA binding protein